MEQDCMSIRNEGYVRAPMQVLSHTQWWSSPLIILQHTGQYRGVDNVSELKQIAEHDFIFDSSLGSRYDTKNQHQNITTTKIKFIPPNRNAEDRLSVKNIEIV